MHGPLQFIPKFIYVEEEWKKTSTHDDKVTELLNKYKRENGEFGLYYLLYSDVQSWNGDYHQTEL